MPKLKLTLSYNGARWQGWQSQPGAVGVQDQVEKAVAAVVKLPCPVHGSGRTDAGVHALAQVAHVVVPEAYAHMKPEHWVRALNAELPRSVRVMQCQQAAPRFHARYDAVAKTYLYRIHRGSVLPPLESERAWHIFGELDEQALQAAAAILQGRHNFARLSVNRGETDEATRRATPARTTRSVYSIHVEREGDILNLRFRGEGFLYKMVRLMVGAMVHIARGKAQLAWLDDLLTNIQGEKNHHCAPPDGLYLLNVEYESQCADESSQVGFTAPPSVS
jgi:tRNA pseudouridine38-40 synthase